MTQFRNSDLFEASETSAALRELWEKAKRINELMRGMRDEIALLREKNRNLEAQTTALAEQLHKKDEQIKDLEENSPSHIDVGERLLYFTVDEREALERQIDDLLVKIKPHLG
jgi:hypothetical protein